MGCVKADQLLLRSIIEGGVKRYTGHKLDHLCDQYDLAKDVMGILGLNLIGYLILD